MATTKMTNAADIPLNANSGGVPNVADAMYGYFQPMTFGLVAKERSSNFEVVETQTEISFLAVWQPLTERQLMMKPEGERKWSWYWMHAEIGCILQPDDVVTYLGVQYRVMTQKNYSLYGYVEYHLVDDYTGAGPQVGEE